MAVDYTIIIRVRQRFGDDKSEPLEPQLETGAPFVGASKEFAFATPNVDRSQDAILQFQSLGVSHRANVIQINGTGLFGGLSTSIEGVATEFAGEFTGNFVRQMWMTHSLLVQPGLLRAENTLRIESRDGEGGTGGNLDNFIIDNALIFYKTRPGGFGPVAADTA